MQFNRHLEFEGQHAILSASNYHWINYSPEKMIERVHKLSAAAEGTKRHSLAQQLILLKEKLPDKPKTLNMYVNDCIGYRMQPEQIFFYSRNAFGTADAAKFEPSIFRCFDLKTGETKTSEKQLYVYAALFCLEYKIKPASIEYDLRIYQNDDVLHFEVDPADIIQIMGRIVEFDELINSVREEWL